MAHPSGFRRPEGAISDRAFGTTASPQTGRGFAGRVGSSPGGAFDHVGGGLVVKGEKALGFMVAGEDGKFVTAEAVVQGDQVIVSSPMVEKPANVRYGWKNFTALNLWNKAGLPASPFRTDDTPYTTKQAKKK